MRGLLLRGMIGGDRDACGGRMVVVVVLRGWVVGGSGWVVGLVARGALSLGWARFGLGAGLLECDWVVGRRRSSMWKIRSVVQPVWSLCMPTYAVSPDLK